MVSIDKRDQIITAGSRVFPKLGYHGTTVEDVIREAGVARSTFYSYYSDKRELFLEIVSARTTEIVRILTDGIDSMMQQFGAEGATVPDQAMLQAGLSALMVEIFKFVRRNRGLTKIFLHEMVVADKEFTRIFNDYQEALIKQAQRFVEYGILIGVIDKTDSRRAAEFFVSVHMQLARSFSASTGRYDVEEISHQFVSYQFEGLVKRGGARDANQKKAARGAKTVAPSK